MRLHEAKTYFRTLGQLYREQKKESPSAARDFMRDEKVGDEFKQAFTVARVLSQKHIIPQVLEEIRQNDAVRLNGFMRLNEYISAVASYSKEREWENLIKQTNAINRNITVIGEIIAEQQSNGDRFAVAITTGNSVLGLRLGNAEISEKMGKIVASLPIAAQAVPLFESMSMTGALSLYVRQNGRNLAEFASTDFRKPTASEDLLGYAEMLVSMVNASYNYNTDAIEIDHNQKAFKAYPFATRNALAEAGNIAASMYYLNPELLQKTLDDARVSMKFGDPDGVIRAAIARCITFFKNVDEFKEKVRKAVFTPNALSSPAVRDVFTFYLTHSNKNIVDYALSLMGVGDGTSLKEIYRDAEILEHKETQPEFYHLIGEKLIRLLEISERLTFPLVEDLELTLNEDIEPNTAVGFSDIKNLIAGITRLPTWRDVVLSNIDIDWDSSELKSPSAWTLTLDSSHPNKFSMHFEYKGDEEETLVYTVNIDTAKQAFDWSALESPEIHTDLRKRYMSFAHRVLTQIQHQSEELDRARKNKIVHIAKSPSSTREERMQNYQPTVKTKEKKEPTKEAAYSLNNLDDNTPKVTNTVEPPDEEHFTSLRGVSPVIITAIRQSIENVNQGTEIPLPIKSRGPEGQKQYKVRTGDYRTILMEKEFTAGQRNLVVRNIKHRKDAYRQKGMIKKL